MDGSGLANFDSGMLWLLNISHHMYDIQHSIARPDLLTAVSTGLSEVPVVALLGARQIGKTTLARQAVSTWPGPSAVFDLEVAADREALGAAPELSLRDREGLVVIDEVQRMPELFEVLRPISDDPNRKAVFLLLGSASLELIKGISETLAGRIQFIDVNGFTLAEVGHEDQRRLWLQGGFPRAYLATGAEPWTRWMESFTRTFLERDIPSLGSRVSPAAVGRFWRMLAHYHGQTWNAARVGQSLDLASPTVNRYRDLLVGSFMIRVLPPWFENLGKRIVKSPKVYFRDSGMFHYFLGLQEPADLQRHPRIGASWEGFAMQQILTVHGERESYFFRTQRGAELDLLLLRKGSRWGFEFKYTDAPGVTKSMRTVIDDLKLSHLWVVYPGQREYPLADKITALPLTRVWNLNFQAAS